MSEIAVVRLVARAEGFLPGDLVAFPSRVGEALLAAGLAVEPDDADDGREVLESPGLPEGWKDPAPMVPPSLTGTGAPSAPLKAGATDGKDDEPEG